MKKNIVNFNNILSNFYSWKENIYLTSNEGVINQQLTKYKFLSEFASKNVLFWKDKKDNNSIYTTTISKEIISPLSHFVSDNIKENELRSHFKSNPAYPFRNKYQVFLSAGKNKKLTYFLYDKEMWEEYISLFLKLMFISNYNYSSKSRIAFLGTSDIKHTQYRIANVFPKKQVGIFGLQQPIDSFIKSIEEFQPDVIIGYSSAIGLAARYVSSKVQPRCVITSTDYLSEKNKSVIIEKWKIKPLNIFTMTEAGILAFECNKGSYHLNEEHIFYKKINGINTFTNLVNKIQPFIHYHCPDAINFSENENCSCGLPYKTLKIQGKGRENVILQLNINNKQNLIHPIAIRSALDTITGIYSSDAKIVKEKIQITIIGNVRQELVESILIKTLSNIVPNIEKNHLSIILKKS